MAVFGCSIFCAAVWVLLMHSCIAQFLSPTNDFIHVIGHMNITVRYKEVPGTICETTLGVKTYTGYIDVDENTHMFFWLFEARNQNSTTAPLTIWIDGGPGTPMESTIFAENGPCGITDRHDIYSNPYSWNNVTNMLYIDQPVNTGFSYSTAVPGYLSTEYEIVGLPNDECPEWLEEHQTSCGTYAALDTGATPNGTVAAEDTFWRSLQGFVGAFPQYSSNGLTFTSESYGGHYGPVYTSYILRQNTAISNGSIPHFLGAKHLDLSSYFVNNGWYNPLIQYESHYNFTVSPGNTYSLRPFSTNLEKKMFNAFFGPGNCRDQLLQCESTGRSDVCRDADNFCAQVVESLLDRQGISEYDIRETSSNPFPYSFYGPYLNRADVLAAIGAEVNYTDNSIIISDTFDDSGDDGRALSEIQDLTFLYESGVYIVMPFGDADYICNWLGGEVVAQKAGPAGYTLAGFQNLSTFDNVTHGQVKQYGTFAFVRIYESGHEVAFYQPVASLTMLNRTLNFKDIATGQVHVARNSTYRSSGPLQSTYYNGGSTLIDHNIPYNSTYNTTTNRPNPPGLSLPARSGKKKRSWLNGKRLLSERKRRTLNSAN